MRCPKCGFRQPIAGSECLKCGVIFSRLTKQPAAAPILTAAMPCEEKGLLHAVFRPVAMVKKYCDMIYNRVLSLIWDELFRGENGYGQAANLAAFFIVSAISLVLYHFEEYADAVIIGALFIYGVDYLRAKQKFRSGGLREKLSLSKTDNGLRVIQLSPENRELHRFDLMKNEIDHLFLSHFVQLRGAFEHAVGEAWRIQLSLKNGSKIVVYQCRELPDAIKQGELLSSALQVPLASGDGGDICWGDRVTGGATSRKRRHEKTRGRNVKVALAEGGSAVHIRRERSFSNLKPLFGRLMEISGFFLFLLIMAAVLKRFGMLLTFLIGPWLGLASRSFYLDLSFHGMLSVFIPVWDWTDLFEYGIAVGIIVCRGWRLLQPISIAIDDQRLKVRISGKMAEEFNMRELREPVLVRKPEPAIFLHDDRRSLKVANLFDAAEQYELMRGIHDARIRYSDGGPQRSGKMR